MKPNSAPDQKSINPHEAILTECEAAIVQPPDTHPSPTPATVVSSSSVVAASASLSDE